ncbi:Putative sugar transporter [Gryllus bimaculatus]|nr:Putative sugar transporter [Gryllus bimaculatus]
MEDAPSTPAPAHPRGGVLAGAKSHWPQFAATTVVFLLVISHYLACHIQTDMYDNVPAWPRVEEGDAMILSWTIAGLLSYPIFAFLLEKLNRKFCIYIVSAILTAACILYKTANTLFLFHVAHCLSAIGNTGALIACTIYVTEIAHNNLRGSLLLWGELMYRVVHASVVFIEAFISKIPVSWFATAPSVLVVLCFLFWLPDTPIYFLRRGNRDGATRSLKWFRRGNTPESLTQEMENIEEVLKATRSDSVSSSNIFQDFFNRHTLRYTGIALVLYLTENFSGDASTTWVVCVLPERLGGDFHDIVYSSAEVIFVAGTFVAFLLCDKTGRRTLLFASAVGCSVCLIPIAICSHVMSSKNEMSIEKLFAIGFAMPFIFFLALGIRTVITVVLTDIFPPKILHIHLVIRGTLHYLVNFLAVNYINPHSWELKVLNPALFWTSSVVCTVAAVFIFKYLPETMKRPTGFVFMENRNDMLLRNM